MKKVFTLLLSMGFTMSLWSQVTTNSSSGLAATYPDLASAITALNGATITAPVTITLLTGNPQTAPAGGYSITATGTAANPITIVGAGAGSTVSAFTPQTSGSVSDAIFKIIGGDYITIDGFKMQENASNSTIAVATNNMTEWGIALLYASTTNGAQNNTIQNNTISLNRTYLNTFGIYSNTRHAANTVANGTTVTADATTAAGSNSFNKVYTNSISNVNYGIVFIGSGLAGGAAVDNGNDIGGSSSGTGNTITNWGGSGATASTYISLTTNNYCIFDYQQINDNVSYNTITSASGLATTTLQHGGILKNYLSTAQPTGTITTTINNNTVTLSNSPTTGQMTGITTQGLLALSTATISINNNNILNGSLSGASATSAVFLAIFGTSAPGTMNINNNTIRGTTTNATTGGFVAIQQQTNGVVNALNIKDNKIGDATAGAVTFSNATNSGTAIGIIVTSTGAAATCALVITGNDFRGIVNTTTGSGANTYISNASPTLSQNISSNTFTNLTINSTGSVTFISNDVALPTGGSMTASSNSIVTGFSKTGAGGTVTLFLTTNTPSSVTTTNKTAQNNNFSNITLTGATIMAGWMDIEGAAAGLTKTISNNTFNNWTCGSGTVTALQVGYSLGSSTVNTNTITNITGTGAVTGITLLSNNVALAVNSNTITGLSSTGTGGAVTGILNAIPTGNVYSNTINTLSSTSTTATVAGISSSGGTANIYSNTINTLSCVGTTSGIANGIMVTAGTAVSVYKNKIYDILLSGASSTTGAVNGVVLSGSSSAAAINVYNNVIGDLKATASTSTDAIRGVSVTATGTTSTYRIYNNSIYINATGGATFGTSGIYHATSVTATTAALDLRNNLIVNLSTPAGIGVTTAFRRSSATLTNYASTSDKNAFIATSIMNDGTTNYTSLATFQTAVSAREVNSFTNEIGFTYSMAGSFFMSVTGSDATFLKPVAGITTLVESGATTITTPSITDDFAGVTRGSLPDIGAFEFAGITPLVTYVFNATTNNNWSVASNWSGNTVPTCSNSATIAATKTCNIDIPNAAAKSLINNGTLVVAASAGLTISDCSAVNTSTLTNNGTLTVTGGTLTINGNFLSPAASTFNQSGGDIIVDGNGAGVGANSVASGTALFVIKTNLGTVSGGNITIVDPPAIGTARSFEFNMGTAITTQWAAAHTLTFGNGVSTDASTNTSGFQFDTYAGLSSSQSMLGSVVVNGGNGTNRWVTTTSSSLDGSYIKGNLTINSGSELRDVTSGGALVVSGNIVNNGTMSMTSVALFLATYTGTSLSASTTAQSISGSGVFRNSTTASTANFTSLTINNSSTTGVTFSDANSLLSGSNTGTVSGTLTLVTGFVNTGSNALVLGISTGTVGTLTYTAGGFASGSTFSRWITSSTGGATITAGSTPTGTAAGVYPFAAGTSSAFVSRNVYLNQTTAATTGGLVNIKYNDVAGTSTVSITDGAYTVNTLSNSNWVVSTTNITGTPAYTMSISDAGLYTAANGNSRITLAAAATGGAHQNGSTLPNAQRVTIPLASLSNTFYVGINGADIPSISITSGDWNNAATWSKGAVPTGSDFVTIASTHTVTINSFACVAAGVTINSGGVLTVSLGDLTVGVTNNNANLTNNGTLNVSGDKAISILTVNGNILIANGSNFNQSGGTIKVDGNAAGVAANSVASGTHLFSIGTSAANYSTGTISITGGTIIIVDPHTSATAGSNWAFAYFGTAAPANNVTPATDFNLQFGDGVSTDAGGSTNGFIINQWEVDGGFKPNVIVNTGTGTNRIVTSNYSPFVVQNLTVQSGEFRASTITTIEGNLTVNTPGIFTGSTTVEFLIRTFVTGASTTASVITTAQTIGGTGTFRNSATTPTANLIGLLINNTNAAGLTLGNDLQLSGILTHTAGIINTGVNTLTVGVSTATLGTYTYTAGRIVGKFKKWVGTTATAWTFPVGTLAANQNATVSFTGGAPSVGGTLTTQFVASNPTTTGLPLTGNGGANIANVSTTGYWTIASGDGLTVANYGVTLNPTGFAGFTGSPTTLEVLKRIDAANPWTLQGTHAASSGTVPNMVISRTGLTSFSDFAMGIPDAVVLPVEFITINAKANGAKNTIQWTTANEEGIKTFAIERSTDNSVWTAIGTKAATGGVKVTNYSYNDENPSVLSYYRIRSIETSGKEQVSKVVAVKRNGGQFALVAVSPIPTTEGVTVDFTVAKNSRLTVTITDIVGKIVKTQSIEAIEGNNSVRLDMSHIAQGAYILSLNDGNSIATQRIVKQ